MFITVTQEVPSGTSPASLSTLDRDYAYTLTTTGKLCTLAICSMGVVIESTDKGHFGSRYFAIYSEGIIIVSIRPGGTNLKTKGVVIYSL